MEAIDTVEIDEDKTLMQKLPTHVKD